VLTAIAESSGERQFDDDEEYDDDYDELIDVSKPGKAGSGHFCLWSPYGIGQTVYIFMLWFVLSFFSSPNLSRRRLDVYHTSTHGVALA